MNPGVQTPAPPKKKKKKKKPAGNFRRQGLVEVQEDLPLKTLGGQHWSEQLDPSLEHSK
jgi:hypothetical protein